MKFQPLAHGIICGDHCLQPVFVMVDPLRGIRGKLLLSRKLHYFREGAVSHNVLYYQQLSIACYQVRFYGTNYVK